MVEESATGSVGQTGSGLRPVLGLRSLVGFYLVTIFGLRLVPLVASIGPSVVALWVVALLLYFVPMALAVVDLSSRYPQEGGIYVWAREAFGPFHGFLTAWTYWTVNLVFFPAVLLFTATQAAFVIPGHAELAESKLFLTGFAVAAMVAILVLNVLGLEVSSRFHDLSALARFAIVALLVGLAVASWLRFGSATDLSPSAWVPSLSSVKDLVFLAGLVYMISGIESASTLGDEVRDASRTIPRAVLVTGVLVIALYCLSALALMVSLPAEQLTGLQGFTDVVAASSSRLGGEVFAAWVTSLTALLIVVVSLGIVSAWFAVAARMPFVVGLDRYLPPIFGHVNRRFGSPDVALGTYALATIAFILVSNLGGRIEQIYTTMVSLEIVAYFIPLMYVFAALIWLADREGPAGAYRVPGGRRGAVAAGVAGLAVTGVMIVLALIPGEDVGNVGIFYLSVFGSLALNLATAVLLYLIALWRR